MGLRRRDFDLAGGVNDWYSLYQDVESSFPLGLYQSSDFSRDLLASIDYETIGKRRRANYRALLATIGEHALFPELPEQVVPLGFPVKVDPNLRDGVLRRLYSRNVYAPVHWKIDHSLARSLLTLICDQRYSTDDMIFEASEFKNALDACSRASSLKAPLS